MKAFVLIIALLGVRPLATHAQTIPVLLQQLAALQDLLHTSEKGYQLVGDGLQHIGDITRKEFQLHTDFFDSLLTINPALNADPKLTGLRTLQTTLIQQLDSALNYWRRQRSIQH